SSVIVVVRAWLRSDASQLSPLHLRSTIILSQRAHRTKLNRTLTRDLFVAHFVLFDRCAMRCVRVCVSARAACVLAFDLPPPPKFACCSPPISLRKFATKIPPPKTCLVAQDCIY